MNIHARHSQGHRWPRSIDVKIDDVDALVCGRLCARMRGGPARPPLQARRQTHILRVDVIACPDKTTKLYTVL